MTSSWFFILQLSQWCTVQHTTKSIWVHQFLFWTIRIYFTMSLTIYSLHPTFHLHRTPRLCFTPVCFASLFFNAPRKFIPLLNLHSLIYGLSSFAGISCVCFLLFCSVHKSNDDTKPKKQLTRRWIIAAIILTMQKVSDLCIVKWLCVREFENPNRIYAKVTIWKTYHPWQA